MRPLPPPPPPPPLLLLLLLLASLATAASPAAASSASPTADPAAVSQAPSGLAAVTAIADGLFRVQLGSKRDERPSFQVVNRLAPVPKFTAKSSGDRLTVSTELASVTVDETARSVTFQCSADGSSAAAAQRWSWQPTLDPNEDPLQATMPINAHGMYVMDDSDTARLGGEDSNDVAWWQHPLKLPGPPPPPSPLPPADTCTDLHDSAAEGRRRGRGGSALLAVSERRSGERDAVSVLRQMQRTEWRRLLQQQCVH